MIATPSARHEHHGAELRAPGVGSRQRPGRHRRTPQVRPAQRRAAPREVVQLGAPQVNVAEGEWSHTGAAVGIVLLTVRSVPARPVRCPRQVISTPRQNATRPATSRASGSGSG